MIYMKGLLCDQGFEGDGQSELDNLFNYYRSIHYHDMNEHLARCIVELQNKQDKIEMTVADLYQIIVTSITNSFKVNLSKQPLIDLVNPPKLLMGKEQRLLD